VLSSAQYAYKVKCAASETSALDLRYFAEAYEEIILPHLQFGVKDTWSPDAIEFISDSLSESIESLISVSSVFSKIYY